MGKSTEVKETTALAISQERPSHLAPVQAGKQRGSEHVQTQDLVIPRLEMIQALSPAIKPGDPLRIEGAEQGMIFNTVTRALFRGPLLIVPVLFKKEFIIWKLRKTGGGFKGAFEDEQKALDVKNALEDGKDCEIIDTAQHFCLLLSRTSERIEEVVVSMSRTKMKVSRQWNSLIRLAGDDRFARVYALDVVPESNPKGSFFNWKVTAMGFAPEYAYRAAETLYESVKTGRIIEADRSTETAVEDSDASDVAKQI